jgi:hypothetical protein
MILLFLRMSCLLVQLFQRITVIKYLHSSINTPEAMSDRATSPPLHP